MFNVGDRVKYKEKTSRTVSYNRTKAGLVGTITKLEKSSGEDYATVEFDKEQPFHSGSYKTLYGLRNGCYCDNLEYISFKYDPSQAGDTDDDV